MRDTTGRWQQWRVKLEKKPAEHSFSQLPDSLSRRLSGDYITPDIGSSVASSEEPLIRHDLVARVRQQIADGTYDTEEKWLAAEELMLRHFERI